MNKKYKPGPGWVHLNGPVYENKNGTRIHLAGLCRFKDGTFSNDYIEFSRYIKIAGGNRKRGLMAWANSKDCWFAKGYRIPAIECPYCGKWQEINHDDGYGYSEDEVYEQECDDCCKYFTFTTFISYSYTSRKADCLNGSEHKYKKTCTFPKQYTRMRCIDCDAERQPTEKEWFEILSE